ncbi:hypothetical protein [Streptomyces sp. R527F]|uniref:hypothetical protein n=1 Tax=Streptomyces sp. R527F TaxID=1664033 RepID=UPI001F4269EB|nr:hypothetical protein [Streptomyces sp. R527F]UIZ12016.1 hypothetical protein LZ559_06095 [Streptomyces sp. R527F]
MRWFLRNRTQNVPRQDEERFDHLELLRAKANRRTSALTHLPAYAGAAVVTLMIVKVALVSRGAPSTMLALIADAGVLQVTAGAVILLLPFSGIVVSYANEEIYKFRLMPKVKRREIQVAIYLTIFILSFLLIWSWVATVVGFLLLRHLLFLWDKRRGRAMEQPVPLSRDEWLQRPPSDIVCYAFWQQVKIKLEEKEALQSRPSFDLAAISGMQSEIDALVEQFNERASAIYREKFSQGSVVGSIMISYALILLIQFLSNDRPWFPAEQVELKGGGREVGYVVNSSDSWTTILRERERAVIRIRSELIVSRALCSASGRDEINTKTLWRITLDQNAVYKKCPSPRKG